MCKSSKWTYFDARIVRSRWASILYYFTVANQQEHPKTRDNCTTYKVNCRIPSYGVSRYNLWEKDIKTRQWHDIIVHGIVCRMLHFWEWHGAYGTPHQIKYDILNRQTIRRTIMRFNTSYTGKCRNLRQDEEVTFLFSVVVCRIPLSFVFWYVVLRIVCRVKMSYVVFQFVSLGIHHSKMRHTA